MNEQPKAEPGLVQVDLQSNSYFFTQQSRIEVRDSNKRLVTTMRSGEQTPLQEGLYEISAVLENGGKQHKLVHVRSGAKSEITIEAPMVKASLPEENLAPSQIDISRTLQITDDERLASIRSGKTRSIQTSDDAALERPEAPVSAKELADWLEQSPSLATASGPAVELLELQGVELAGVTNGNWNFECQQPVESVPSAKFRLGDRIVRISLPCSYHYAPANFCFVNVTMDSIQLRARAWVSPERTIASAMQNMLTSGHMFRAFELADDARELLLHKYEDPTAATLGALILQKAGRLEERGQWVRNLAGSFDWMPDGKALLAHLLLTTGGDKTKATELAVAASKQRFLYTESFSLLLELLRRWPGGRDTDALDEALHRLLEKSSYLDWNAVCLTEQEPDGES